MQQELKHALDAVDFWQKKVDRRFHKNAKKLATFNLWAAQEKAQHIAEAFERGEIKDCNERSSGPLPVYVGEKLEYK